MKEVVLQIPVLEAEQNIEIDVKINGRKRTLRYRVDIVGWEKENPSAEEKVKVLREAISELDRDWQVIQIGVPTDDSIPIMFRKRETQAQIVP